jgi:ubiquinone/menaquinone biosynthesis C-methylase UbiE
MRKVFPQAKLVGVDISSAMVAQARRNLEKYGQDLRIEVRQADANALPFATETFNCVVSTGSLHHWKHPYQALSEAHRVLKPNGHALIYDLVRHIPKAICEDVQSRFGVFRLALLRLHSFAEPFLNADEMEALGKQTAFSVEGTKLIGVLCCLVLKKAAFPATHQRQKS